MRRALVTAILLASGSVAADETVDDPKAAIADRGLVLKAGKRHFIVAVPPAVAEPETPQGAKLYRAQIFVGTAKSLVDYTRSGGSSNDDREDRDLAEDPRFIYSATLRRIGQEYSLACATTFRDGTPARIIPLTVGTAKDVAKATVGERPHIRMAVFLARLQGSTTYLYLDHRGPEETSELRVLLGKRGALKPVPIKEIAKDATSLVVVTGKGVLTVKYDAQRKVASATWGPTKKPVAVDVLPVIANRKLIYQELGIYTREPSGYVCDEL